VLVVGAGPVGLTLANDLVRYGVGTRLVERHEGLGSHSRAVNVWARTQEVLAAIGVRDEIEHHAISTKTLTVYIYGRLVGQMSFSKAPSPYPEVLSIAQWSVQNILAQTLEERGLDVEYGSEVVAVREEGDHVAVTVRCGGEDRIIRARYVAACDGGRSTIREQLGVGLEEMDLPRAVILQIDARLDWSRSKDPSNWYMFTIPGGGQGGVVPLPDRYFRVFVCKHEGSLPNRRPEVEEMQGYLREMSGDRSVRLWDPVWSGHGTLQAGIAASFRYGRVLLVGDSGHMTIPVGAQGMNTGMQDAFNLGWKLAAVLDGTSPESLMDTYSVERQAVRRALAQEQADSFFRLMQPTPRQQLQTRLLAPVLVRVGRMNDLPRRDFNGLDIAYPDSPLTEDRVRGEHFAKRGLKAGSRAPDATVVDAAQGRRTVRLFDLIYSGGWTLLAFDAAQNHAVRFRMETVVGGVLSAFPGLQTRLVLAHPDSADQVVDGASALFDLDEQAHRRFKVREPLLFLIRPDGYVGFRAPLEDVRALLAYLRRVLSVAAPPTTERSVQSKLRPKPPASPR
jgi:2-polyprenyl-6-methoxyphenol hydroxylase-like FAD-dependent oxidoreductase